MDENDMEMEMGTPPSFTRSLEIELGDQVIAIDLDSLDQNTEDVIDVLQDAQCKVMVWTQLASEYWRRGWLESAQRITNAAVDFFKAKRDQHSLIPVYLLLANIQIESSRAAAKMKLPNAKLDVLGPQELLKDVYLAEATSLMNHAGATDQSTLFFLTRGIHQLAKTSTMNEALVTFEGILQSSPTNLVALHGKARIMYAKKNYRESMSLYQRILTLSPYSLPDPRIGIGLCLWQMGDKSKARRAWERSLEVHPKQWATELLLGLESLNSSKDGKKTEEQRHQAYAQGSKSIQRAFTMNQKSAAAANCLSEYFIRRGETQKALKLAERAIQFADTLAVVNEGYLRAGRVAHLEGRYDDAITHYTNARNLPLASLGIAQCHIKKGETPAAIHVLDTMLNGPESLRTTEAMVMLASLRASERPALSSQEAAADKIKARDLFERVKKSTGSTANGPLKANGVSSGVSGKKPAWMSDMEMYLEIARLWEKESMEKAMIAYQEARKISETSARGVDPRIVNNVGVLEHLQDKLPEARAQYEVGLGVVATSWANDENMDGISTTLLYNLARVYEDQGEGSMAKEAYDKLLNRHPEYIDAKVRLAHMLISSNRNNEAHALLKQALDAQVNNLNLRAYYTHFLLQSSLHQHALKFVHSTLQMNKSDLYGTCAAAWLHYQLAREIRSTNEQMIRDRRHKFHSAAEFYEKALSIDPGCAIAAQGLAIIVAEDALGVMSLKPAGAAVEDEETRMRNTRDALDVFAKVREVIADGSVYTNMGHCYYMREEYERAIESYETGLSKYYDNQNSSILLCLARTWYAKGARDQSFASMKNALRIAQQAQQIVPADKAIRYNIAVIEQRAAELVFSLPVAKRTLEELQQALEHATHAQHFLFALSEDKSSGSLPYDRVMAEQRHMYGTALLRKGTDQVAQQEKYEGEQRAKLEATRETRMAERAAAQAKEQARLEELQREAEALAEERRKAREEAALWAAQHRDDTSEDEKPKRRKKEKSATDDLFDDDDAEIITPKEPKEKKEKKPRVVRKRKGKDGQGGEEGHSSGAEDADKLERPKKRLTKKRVVNDEEEEEGEHRARKKFKSADVIDDSDEELERLDRLEEERLRLSKAVLTDGENEGKNSANEDVDMA
ncbi:TPR-like protein [Serendipita vermifera]|nr:TPR-like protein [Serendipita vermifera]